MFSKKTYISAQSNIDTLVGPNAAIEGNLEAEGNIRVDGRIKGNINVNGTLILGKDSSVTGDIAADTLELAGRVEGNVTARELLKLHSTTQLFGDIFVRSFIAEEGSIFQGRCTMIEVAPQEEVRDRTMHKKNGSRNFKKSTLIDQTFEDTGKAVGGE